MFVSSMNLQHFVAVEYFVAHFTGRPQLVNVHSVLGIAVLLLEVLSANITPVVWVGSGRVGSQVLSQDARGPEGFATGVAHIFQLVFGLYPTSASCWRLLFTQS